MKTLKVVLVGDSCTQKSSLLDLLFAEGSSGENIIKSAFSPFPVKVGDQELLLNVWDTAGQERFHSATLMYCRSSDICLVCFSYDSVESLEHASAMWVPQLREQVGPSAVVMLVGIGFKLAREDYEMLEAVGESAFGDCPVKEEMVQKVIADTDVDGFMYCCSQMKDSVNMVVEKAAEIYLEKQKEMGIETKKEQEVEMEKKHKRRWWQRKHK